MSDDSQLVHPTEVDNRGHLPPLPRPEAIIPSGRGAEGLRELYGALMAGFGDAEQLELEQLMIDNITRLRDDGDSYAP
jgi:hypothetical protein